MLRILLTGGQGMVGQNIREHHRAKSLKVFASKSAELDLTDERSVRDYIKPNGLMLSFTPPAVLEAYRQTWLTLSIF